MESNHPRECKVYQTIEGKWAAITNHNNMPLFQKRDLTFLQYNIMFKRDKWEKRMEGLGALITQLNPDVICLQEVTQRLITALIAQPWARVYFVTDPELTHFKHHGVVILSKVPILTSLIYDLPTSMDRKALLVTLQVETISVCVATFHLASGRGSVQQRKQQVNVLNRITQNHTHVIMMGDANMASSNENNSFDKRFKDMWLLLSFEDPGYTIGNAARLDRVYLSRNNVEPISLEIVGKQPMEDGLCISDHYGLYGSVNILD